MGKERVMKHAVPLKNCQEQERLYDFIEVTFRDDSELKRDEMTEVEDEKEEHMDIVIDHTEVLKNYVNISIRILFIAVMSIHILWMQYLETRYTNTPLIQLVKWLMITLVVGYIISWIKPYDKVFWKIHAHD